MEQPATDVKLYPGDVDAMRFNLDISVQNWSNYGMKTVSGTGERTTMNQAVFGSTVSSNGPDLNYFLDRVRQKVVVKDSQSAAYWAYHFARLSFFVSQAAAGLVAHEVAEMIRGDLPADASTAFGRITTRGGPGSQLSNLASEAVASWEQDYRFIEQGLFKLPWDMTTLSHRQYSPLFAARRTLTFIDEAVATFSRRSRNQADELWMKSDMYPSYYTNSYHYQSDGWLSSRSAEVYEHSTETLFLGRQDAMQRTSLVPISMWISESGIPESQVRLLEIAAGTGRFHTYVKDNWPEMKTICSDLSPFYLAKARENLKYWKSMRQPSKSLGGPDGTGVTMLQSSAESLNAVADESQHIVVNIYTFHELPEESRRKVVSEMFRVLKHGGLAVWTDSVQLGDRPEWNGTLGNFQDFNEPYYGSYISSDIGAMFQEAGFICSSKWVNSSTKTLSFLKPSAAALN